MKFLIGLLCMSSLVHATTPQEAPKKVIVSYAIEEIYEQKKNYIAFVHEYTLENGIVVDIKTERYDNKYEKHHERQ